MNYVSQVGLRMNTAEAISILISLCLLGIFIFVFPLIPDSYKFLYFGIFMYLWLIIALSFFIYVCIKDGDGGNDHSDHENDVGNDHSDHENDVGNAHSDHENDGCNAHSDHADHKNDGCNALSDHKGEDHLLNNAFNDSDDDNLEL